MGSKYGYNESDAKAAGERTAESLTALATQLKSQYARGVHYFVGDALSALDIYWTAFANLLDPLPKEQCPMPEAYRPGFSVSDPVVKEALTRCCWNIARESFASTSAIRWNCERTEPEQRHPNKLRTVKYSSIRGRPAARPTRAHSRLEILSRPAVMMLGMFPGMSIPPLISNAIRMPRC